MLSTGMCPPAHQVRSAAEAVDQAGPVGRAPAQPDELGLLRAGGETSHRERRRLTVGVGRARLRAVLVTGARALRWRDGRAADVVDVGTAGHAQRRARLTA